MENLLTTLLLAFFLVILAVSLLAISWILTGKSNIEPGACGRAPNKKRDKQCGNQASCELCKKEEDLPSDDKRL